MPNHVLETLIVIRRCTVYSPLTWPSNLDIRWHWDVCDNRSNGWLQHPAGDHVCRDRPACGHHTGLYLSTFPFHMGADGDRPEIDIKPPLGVPILIFPRVNILKSFPHEDISARQRRFGIRVVNHLQHCNHYCCYYDKYYWHHNYYY